MLKNINLEYLCVNLGNLSAMPVRLYNDKSRIFYYSIISLPKDPFELYVDDVFAIVEHVGYFITPDDFFYGVVNFDNKRLVVGPTRQTPAGDNILKKLAFDIGVPHEDTDDFVRAMKSIVQMPLVSIMQMLSIVNHVLNNGEQLSLTDIAIYDVEQEKLMDVLAKEAAERTIRIADDTTPYLHNSMDIEEYMLSMIRTGDVEALQEYFRTLPAIRSGVMAQDELRQAKNLLIVTATLVSREVIRAGMDVEEALTLSDNYIQKTELLHSPIAVANLNYRLLIDYAERMQRLHYGGNPSKLVKEVINYVRNHLSEPVTVEALARYLCKGRCRLSTEFKQLSGENLSDFILKQKIEEGKRLLRYTDKPAIEIAMYLGFSSQSHFSRTFKKYVLLTPNEYRAKHREK